MANDRMYLFCPEENCIGHFSILYMAKNMGTEWYGFVTTEVLDAFINDHRWCSKYGTQLQFLYESNPEHLKIIGSIPPENYKRRTDA